jgi:DNA-binding beta-propeller fold protein YncE
MRIRGRSSRLPAPSALLALGLALGIPAARAQSSDYVNFEAHQTRPICLSADGTRLFAVNTPDGRLSVFDVSNPANPAPVLIRESSVGLEPVSVNAVSNDEAWVVNQVSDSVSIVSVATGNVIDTLICKDEPSDVVFAAGHAFVSCSRNNLVRVFNLASRVEVGTIPLQGLSPRSLAVSHDGTKVFAAFAMSGNRTTLLPVPLAPAQPAPTNVSLPAPPQVGLIVSADDARLSPKPNLPDNDVAEIDAATRTVNRYFKGTGTVNFFVAPRPGSTELWVANTEARNLVRFEPDLKGHLVDNRVTRVNTEGAGTVTPFDLNPGVDYAVFPNDAARATALAQPVAIEFEPDGAFFWVASFGSDRVARIDAASGAVVARIETGPTTGVSANSRAKRGPRGLAYQAAAGRLYVSNRITNSISTISTQGAQVLAEIATGSFDPTPDIIRQGRGFLYDARLSGNGTQSCASCHIDGDRDELAWDLGDRGGVMQTVTQPNPLGGPPQTFNMHPMKGPMATQTLRGLVALDPLHWRGDRADFTQFNAAFASLLGGSAIPAADMAAFRDFINTIVLEPNPNQNLDRTLPASVVLEDGNTGNPNTGRTTYLNDEYRPGLRCNTCHSLPTGSNLFIIPAGALLESQDFKVPHLRNVWQKRSFVRSSTTASLSGFGIGHDGTDPDIFTFLSRPVFGSFATDTTRKRNLSAFLLCFDTGTAPATGYGRTAVGATLASVTGDWTMLEAQATAGNIELILRGLVDGKRHGFRYRPGNGDYASDQAGLGPFTRAQLQNMIISGSAGLTLMGVPPGRGDRLARDRNADGVLDGDESLPALHVSLAGGSPVITWPSAEAALVLEFTENLSPPDWQTVTLPRVISGATVSVEDGAVAAQRFYRLRRP